jgi:protein TonB
MKTATRFALLSAILSPVLLAQTNARPTSQHPYEIQISSGVAEKLLIQKADIICPRMAMPPRIKATVVVGIEIDRNGNVLHSTVISGPAMLRKPVLDAVRKYKYKPYLLNGRAVDVETTDSVVVDLEHGCPYGYTIR